MAPDRTILHLVKNNKDRELDLQNLVWYKVGSLRGGSSGASVRGPESQERARESLKCPIDLTNDVLF
jgi:hypothetical protein